jgi:hypothetical protein
MAYSCALATGTRVLVALGLCRVACLPRCPGGPSAPPPSDEHGPASPPRSVSVPSGLCRITAPLASLRLARVQRQHKNRATKKPCHTFRVLARATALLPPHTISSLTSHTIRRQIACCVDPYLLRDTTRRRGGVSSSSRRVITSSLVASATSAAARTLTASCTSATFLRGMQGDTILHLAYSCPRRRSSCQVDAARSRARRRGGDVTTFWRESSSSSDGGSGSSNCSRSAGHASRDSCEGV